MGLHAGLSHRTLPGFLEAFPAVQHLIFRPRLSASLQNSLDWQSMFQAVRLGTARKLARGGAPLQAISIQRAPTLQDDDVACLLYNLDTLQ